MGFTVQRAKLHVDGLDTFEGYYYADDVVSLNPCDETPGFCERLELKVMLAAPYLTDPATVAGLMYIDAMDTNGVFDSDCPLRSYLKDVEKVTDEQYELLCYDSNFVYDVRQELIVEAIQARQEEPEPELRLYDDNMVWERGGPWPSVNVVVMTDGGYIGPDGGEPPTYELICQVYQGAPDYSKPPPDKAVKDANLIAAAPALFRSLRQAVKELSDFGLDVRHHKAVLKRAIDPSDEIGDELNFGTSAE